MFFNIYFWPPEPQIFGFFGFLKKDHSPPKPPPQQLTSSRKPTSNTVKETFPAKPPDPIPPAEHNTGLVSPPPPPRPCPVSPVSLRVRPDQPRHCNGPSLTSRSTGPSLTSHDTRTGLPDRAHGPGRLSHRPSSRAWFHQPPVSGFTNRDAGPGLSS